MFSFGHTARAQQLDRSEVEATMLGSRSGGRALSATMLGKPGLQLNARVTIWGTHYSNYWSEWDHLETSQSRGIQIFWHSAQDLGNYKVFWTPKLPSIMGSKLSNVFINWAMWSCLWWGPSWSSAVLKKNTFLTREEEENKFKTVCFYIFSVRGFAPN